MNSELVNLLAMVAGVILSLALAYVGPFKKWYEPKPSEEKVAWMGAFLFVAALAVFGMSCGNIWFVVACTKQGAIDLLSALLFALIANQSSFTFAVKPFRKVREFRSDGSEVEAAG
ncbi:MAG TPA: hypothetical protein VIY48_02340 [Candidatus Paceibacterota bacterium]